MQSLNKYRQKWSSEKSVAKTVEAAPSPIKKEKRPQKKIPKLQVLFGKYLNNLPKDKLDEYNNLPKEERKVRRAAIRDELRKQLPPPVQQQKKKIPSWIVKIHKECEEMPAWVHELRGTIVTIDNADGKYKPLHILLPNCSQKFLMSNGQYILYRYIKETKTAPPKITYDGGVVRGYTEDDLRIINKTIDIISMMKNRPKE